MSTKTLRPTEARWKEGTRFSIDPQAANRRLEEMREELGRELTGEDVLEEATRIHSPLRDPLFYFDDPEKAIKAYRVEIARKLLTSLVVNVQIDDADPIPVPVWSGVEPTGGGAKQKYEKTLEAMENPSAREIIVENAFRQFEALQNRFRHLQELAGVFTAIEAARAARKKKR